MVVDAGVVGLDLDGEILGFLISSWYSIGVMGCETYRSCGCLWWGLLRFLHERYCVAYAEYWNWFIDKSVSSSLAPSHQPSTTFSHTVSLYCWLFPSFSSLKIVCFSKQIWSRVVTHFNVLVLTIRSRSWFTGAPMRSILLSIYATHWLNPDLMDPSSYKFTITCEKIRSRHISESLTTGQMEWLRDSAYWATMRPPWVVFDLGSALPMLQLIACSPEYRTRATGLLLYVEDEKWQCVFSRL